MNPVTTAHIHLILSHVPVMAVLFGLGLLAFGVWRGSQDIQKAALGTFIAAALLAVPSYLTGEPASGTIKGLPGYSEHILERHQASAGIALASCIALGIMALAGLIHFRGRAVTARFVALLLLGALVVGVLMARTANLGGQVRHSEIRDYDPANE